MIESKVTLSQVNDQHDVYFLVYNFSNQFDFYFSYNNLIQEVSLAAGNNCTAEPVTIKVIYLYLNNTWQPHHSH